MSTINNWLRENGETFREELKILAREYFGISKAQLITVADEIITSDLSNYLSESLLKLKAGTPLAYLLGYKEFWSLKFQVDHAVLIPRPETELIVEKSIELASYGGCVLELGTGSGAVSIALAKERPDLKITATDISNRALEVARRNAKEHKCEIFLEHTDWFDSITGKWNLILSNPPYIAASDPHLEFLAMEPQIALVAGQTGFEAINRILSQAHKYLKPSGHLIMEHGLGQEGAIKNKLANRNFSTITSHKDLANISRVVTAQWIEL